eukprot:22874-Prymnesium_polylepis.1
MGRAFEEALGPDQPDGHAYHRPAGYGQGASSFAHAYPYRDADWPDESLRGAVPGMPSAGFGASSAAGVPAGVAHGVP